LSFLLQYTIIFSDETFRVGLRVIIFSFLKCKLVQVLVLKEIFRLRLQFIHCDLLFKVYMIQLGKNITYMKKTKGITTKTIKNLK